MTALPEARRRALLSALQALLAGALAVPAFAPFQWWPLVLVSLGSLFALWHSAPNARAAAWRGFCWGFGLFAAGIGWLYIAVHVYGDAPAPLAALAIALFAAYLALFPALAGWLGFRLRMRMAAGEVWSLLVIAPTVFTACEVLRGSLMTGFPWLTVGYTQTPGGFLPAPLAGYAAVGGVFALSWLLAMTAAVLLWAVRHWRATTMRVRVSALLMLLVLWAGGVALREVAWSVPSGAPLTVALLQGNVEQQIKWREDQRAATLENYLDLNEQAQARLVVMPETALPMWLDQVPRQVLGQLHARVAARGGDIIIGVPVAARTTDAGAQTPGYRYANSAVTLGASPSQRYDKQHLVPFGEYIPPAFAWVYQWLKIPLANLSAAPEHARALHIAGHRIAVNICYEDIFGSEVARPAAEAELLVNMSNMAWYGRSLAAEQHLQFSQMRALETSRWMLRATNTGLTAAINEQGEVVQRLPQFTRGVLAVEAVPRQGVTPYVRWRDLPVEVALVLVLLLIFVRGTLVRPKMAVSSK